VRGTHQDGTGVYAALYADQDFTQHWLLEVHTYRPNPEAKTSTCVVDALWACREFGDVNTAWFHEPRLFFDRGADWHTDAYHWFADQVEAYWDEKEMAHARNAGSFAGDNEAHNESVRQADRDKAAAIGIVLPVHGTPTNYRKKGKR
jgi:hypothetical protein